MKRSAERAGISPVATAMVLLFAVLLGFMLGIDFGRRRTCVMTCKDAGMLEPWESSPNFVCECR